MDINLSIDQGLVESAAYQSNFEYCLGTRLSVSGLYKAVLRDAIIDS
jgi:hypothetical protein